METAKAPPPPRRKAPVPLLIDASGKSGDRPLEGAASSSNFTEARRGGGTRGGGSSLEAESVHGQVRPALDMRWEVEVRFFRHPLPSSSGGDAAGARRQRAGRWRVCS